MRNSILAFAFSVLSLAAAAQLGAGALKATITDGSSGAPMPFVNVALKQGGLLITGGQSDFDGNVEIKPVQPGTYTVEITTIGYGSLKIENVRIVSESTNKLSKDQTKMYTASTALDEFTVSVDRVELFSTQTSVVQTTMDKEDIKKMAARSPAELAAQTSGTVAKDDGSGNINFRGARNDANYYYIDGVKVRGSSNIPRGAIDQISVITGGVPARYGDVTGGIISITTRGVASQYKGTVELLSSGIKFGENAYVGLDPYGYNLVEASLSGPFLSKTDSLGVKTPLMGFSLSGNFFANRDPRPSAVGAWKIKEDVLEDLKTDPLRQGFTANSVIPNTDYLRLNDFERVKVRPNTENYGANLNAKITMSPTSNTDVAVGGSLNFSDGIRYDYDNALLNYENYPQETNLDWRGYARFTQRFGSDQSNEESGASLIKNAFYSIQADYSQEYFRRQNPELKDDFFKYGYIGKFQTSGTRDYAFGQDSATGKFGNIHQTFLDTLITFTPGDANPELARFTERYYELNGWEGFDAEGNPIYNSELSEAFQNYNNIQSGGGMINGDNLEGRSRSVYGMWIYNSDVTNAQNTGLDNYNKTITNQIRLSGQGSADIKNHAVVLGFEYEQRVDRAYSLSPRYLWTIARLRTNSHIEQLDLNSPEVVFPGPYINYPRLNASPGEYDASDDNEAQSFIDYNLRNTLGLNPDGIDFVDVFSLDPDQFDVKYFSADELYNDGSSVVSYYGFDAYGDKQTSRPTFDDFFTKRDEFGNLTRPIAPFQPIYVAGYLEDRFEFDDLIFNVGLRVDRYDANQQVLKDDYVLFPTVKAGEDEAIALLGDNERPGNIGDDFVVYVDNVENPTQILGYRDGKTWYSADGAELSDASSLRISSGLPAPLLVDKENTSSVDITSESFEDYKPQTNFMPRVAFNFAVSDDAKFFAHYDVLTKRPTDGQRLDASDYYYLESRASTAELNNPALQPERTVDYEVGYAQKLTASSALTITAFYRESRNMVSVTRVFDAYPIEYVTYDNIDFSTVKGMTVSFDQRQNKNLTFRLSYTLQYAEGTGSNSTSQLNLARTGQPNLRAPIRLGYDQRHQLVGNVDYRFGDGADYNGPMVGEKRILKNTGANLQVRGGSGDPYNPQSNYTSTVLFSNTPPALQKGAINSASLPWNFRFDLVVDRNFQYEIGNEKKRIIDYNVYVQVLNLLNARNINGVYRATGNPTDDGFLSSSLGQQLAASQNSPSSFEEYYTMKLWNPNNYQLPRRIRLGLRLNF